METVSLSRVRLITAGGVFSFPATTSIRPQRRQPVFAAAHPASAFRTGVFPVSELVEEEILKGFLRERRLNGDFITKTSDFIWRRGLVELIDSEVNNVPYEQRDDQQDEENDDVGGFLKLSRTREWVLGDDSAPVNKKLVEKELVDDREKRKRLNLLNYGAVLHLSFIGLFSSVIIFVAADYKLNTVLLKRELILVSVGVGAACSGYCLVVFSLQAALSYALGVLFSSCSDKRTPCPVFRLKKQKKIGIRSEDLSDALERWTKGSSISLSSLRLVIPAAIFGLWVLSDQFLANDSFHFELALAMMGMFVYKADSSRFTEITRFSGSYFQKARKHPAIATDETVIVIGTVSKFH